MDTSRYRWGMGWSPSGRPGLRPHNRLLRGSQLVLPLLPFSRRPSCLMTGTRQDLPLSRTVIDRHRSGSGARSYVGRFACDWLRLAVRPVDPWPGGATTDPDGLHRATVGHDWSPRNPGPNPLPRRRRGRDGEHGQPARLQRPLRLPGRRSGGQHVVADHRPGPPACAWPDVAEPGSGRPSSPPGWPPGPPRRARPGRRPGRAAGAGARRRTSCPARRSRAAAPRVIVQVGSWPRARTVAGRDGTGVSTTGRPLVPASSTAARTARASRSDSGPRSPCMARSLWPSTRARATSAYSAAVHGATRPPGVGLGHAGHAGSPRVVAQPGQTSRPGRSQPTQREPSSRSTAASVRRSSRSRRTRRSQQVTRPRSTGSGRPVDGPQPA